jgi:chromosome partitioning protein
MDFPAEFPYDGVSEPGAWYRCVSPASMHRDGRIPMPALPNAPALDRDGLDRVIAIANGKGGVGKTSVTANIGGLVAASGSPVLLIDLDPQGNLAEDLGYVESAVDDQGRGLVRALLDDGPLSPIPTVRPNLDVVPGGEALHDLSSMLFARRQRDGQEALLALARSLAAVADQYELILLDCPPGEPTMQELALAAAHWVLVPARTDDSSRKGLRKVAQRFRAVRDLNPDLILLGVLLFGTNPSAKRIREEVQAEIAADLGKVAPVFTTTIRYVEAAARDARKRGQLAYELERAAAAGPKSYEVAAGRADRSQLVAASASSLAGDYAALTREVLAHLAAAEAEVKA